jgi:hypothetical protein
MHGDYGTQTPLPSTSTSLLCLPPQNDDQQVVNKIQVLFLDCIHALLIVRLFFVATLKISVSHT